MNRRVWAFHSMFAALPAPYQQAARASFRMFLQNPHHPAFRLHVLAPTKKGQHWPASVSVSISMNYRAISAIRDGINVWYWIGTHAAYGTFVGRK